MLRVRRVYDDPSPDDGRRILVDRLWPRGLSKERAAVDVWLKDVAPSTELRRRFHGGELEFEEFSGAYRAELEANPEVERLRELTREDATLLFGARDVQHNHAQVLADWIGESAGERH